MCSVWKHSVLDLIPVISVNLSDGLRESVRDSGEAVTDVNEQQLDLRTKNSWMLKLEEVRVLYHRVEIHSFSCCKHRF